ncbi:peptidase M49, dipeptidyl-peptidase III [Cadophora sp. DSE1049]|nr:peptidase M49, dipeptidyl-peptidase III [Cadophora sp. DSE1049]
MDKDDVQNVSKVMGEKHLGLENTRLTTSTNESGDMIFNILQASIDTDDSPVHIGKLPSEKGNDVFVVRGDHSQELKRVNEALTEAIKYCANKQQERMLEKLKQFFTSGNLETYWDSQRQWVKDISPRVEVLFGFLEAYRDPLGARAEYEGVICVLDAEGSRALRALCENSAEYISTLPWVQGLEDRKGNGPFESALFEAPEFTSVHALTYASTMVYLGINLPNFEEIRETVGFKNVFIANRHQALDHEELKREINAPFIESTERKGYLLRFVDMQNLNIAIHELLGHGTGKLLTESSNNGEGPNFDLENPPLSPLTGEPITTWYKKGEAYNVKFGDIATSMEECRAECVGAFLISNKHLAALFGYSEQSKVKLDDLVYDLYLHRGVLGLQALRQFSPENNKWGDPHARGDYAIFRALLGADGFMKLIIDDEHKKVKVHIDRSQLESHGRKAIGDLLLKIHVYRCTADVEAATGFYTELTSVDKEMLRIRDIVEHNKGRKEVFIQANLVQEGGKVKVVEYEKSAEGLIRSWVERRDLIGI